MPESVFHDPERQPETAFFDRMYAEHRGAVHAFFAGRTGDAEAALDLLQETFLRVWRHLPTLQAMPPDRCRYWIFAVARNALTDFYRKRSVRAAGEEEILRHPEAILPPSIEPEAYMEEREEMERLDAAIRCLPENLRTVLVMSVVGEMTSGQIAEVLGKPPGTVRNLLFRARKQLAETMRRWDCSARQEAVSK
jgi:RNA polymerase sigma factor (sigma-70 family)